MSTSRRDFVRLAGTATAAARLSSPAFGANEPALGLIFPPKDYPIPPDAKRLYPSGVEFLGDGVGPPGGMTPVVSSTPHGLMNGVRLLGVNPRVHGFGMVFDRA
jgi:hypothetical protein